MFHVQFFCVCMCVNLMNVCESLEQNRNSWGRRVDGEVQSRQQTERKARAAEVSGGGGGARKGEKRSRDLTVRRAHGLYPSIQMIEDERQQEPGAM